MYTYVYKVVVVEDELIILDDIVEKIEKVGPSFKVVGSAYNGKAGLALIQSKRPDIVFTDIRMPMMDGLELIKQIRDEFPETHIVILSGYSEFEYAKQAIKLGVKDYLIKPLLMEALIETLISAKTLLDSRFARAEREIICSEILGLSSDFSLPSTLKSSFFGVFLIIVGNLSNPKVYYNSSEFIGTYWVGINLSSIISSILKSGEKWWIIDDKQPNQKILIFTSENNGQEYFQKVALLLSDKLKDKLAPLPLNICIEGTAIPYSKIWTSAQKARLFIDQHLVLGKSSLFILGLSNFSDSPQRIIENTSLNKISTLIQINSKSLLQKELFEIFEKWNQKLYPQRQIEKNLHLLIRLFQHQIPSISEAEVCHLEYLFSDLLSNASDFKKIYSNIWLLFDGMLKSQIKENEDTKEVIDTIEEYIRANYTNPINLEEIAKKHKIDFSYLAKAFKKYKGETPLKFIISLRILEAKNLMRCMPELDVKEIGEIVGYTDQHYFSRVFKNVTGKSPSEYKLSLTSTGGCE